MKQYSVKRQVEEKIAITDGCLKTQAPVGQVGNFQRRNEVCAGYADDWL